MEPISRRTVLFGTAALALTGCAMPAEPAPSPTPTPSPTPEPPLPTPFPPNPSATPTLEVDLRPRWPLTGELVDDPGVLRRPAVAVKVPDTRPEHPQVGINDADLVFVELDGYPDSKGQSATRLMPVFHSRMPGSVGPVRSIRPVDVPLLSPASVVLGSTGAAGWVKNYAAAHSQFFDSEHQYLDTKGTGAYSIDQSRVRTLNGKKYFDRAVVCHPEALGRLVPRFAEGPARLYLPFATGSQTPSTDAGVPAGSVSVPWKTGDSYSMGYTFDGGVYQRSMPWGPHVLAGGQRVTTDNILVIKAAQTQRKLAAGEGGNEPVHEIIDNTGAFVYCRGGRAVTGTWSKGAVDQPFTFSLDGGGPLVIGSGRTFVELPDAGADVRFS